MDLARLLQIQTILGVFTISRTVILNAYQIVSILMAKAQKHFWKPNLQIIVKSPLSLAHKYFFIRHLQYCYPKSTSNRDSNHKLNSLPKVCFELTRTLVDRKFCIF